MESANLYKKTEVGVIPENWEVRKLGEILKIKHGKSQHHVVVEDGQYPILATGGEIGRANKYLFDKPSVLIGRKGTIDRPQYIETPFWTIDTLFYTEISKKCVAKYIYYLFNRIDWYSYNEASGVPSLNTSTIENINIPLPPLPEQKAIAKVLSDIDELVASIEKLIDKKQKIKQGTMQLLLTGKKRLPGFTGEWEVRQLGDIADIRTGKRNNEDKVIDGEYPFYVRSQKVERIDSYSYEGEAILVPGEGGIGDIYHYIDGRFDYHQRVYKISDFCDDIFGKFVYYCMMQNFRNHAMKNSVKATVDSLRLPTFENFEILYPPLQEQKAIAQILSDMDSEIEALQQKLEKYKLIKEGMMEKLLTGKVRLNE